MRTEENPRARIQRIRYLHLHPAELASVVPKPHIFRITLQLSRKSGDVVPMFGQRSTKCHLFNPVVSQQAVLMISAEPARETYRVISGVGYVTQYSRA